MLSPPCRQAYEATDVRNPAVPKGLEVAQAQLRQLMQDTALADPQQVDGGSVFLSRGGDCGCLNLSGHKSWASQSPLVRHLALIADAEARALRSPAA